MKRGFLEDLGLLVGIEDLGSDEFVEGLARMLAQEGVGFRGIGLLRVSLFGSEVARTKGEALTIFLFTFRIFLEPCQCQCAL